MSRKPENNFIDSVHRHLPVGLYRMKNHNEYVGGVPDVWYSGPISDLWIEYKFLVVPKRSTTMIDLVGGKTPMISALQQRWLIDRHAEGRKVCVVVGCKEGGVWLDSEAWQQPISTGDFIGAIQSRKAIADLITSFVGAP